MGLLIFKEMVIEIAHPLVTPDCVLSLGHEHTMRNVTVWAGGKACAFVAQDGNLNLEHGLDQPSPVPGMGR
jgi:hypothetical protein